MKAYLSFVIIIFTIFGMKAQSKDTLYAVAQQEPIFFEDVPEYIFKHIELPKAYFDSNAVQRNPVCSFIVEKDGSISSILVLQNYNPELDSALVRCIRKMPRAQPGMQNDKPVRVVYHMSMYIQIR